MGKKSEYATSAETCERRGREARDEHDATQWFGLAMYWTVLSRGVRPEDAEDHFTATLDSVGTGQLASGAWH